MTAGPALTEQDLGAVIDAFYAKVRRDPALAPVFTRAIPDAAWPAHLSIIQDFWSSVMLKTGRYRRNPFAVHLRVEGIRPELFDRWLALFRETCAEVLPPAAAAALYEKAVLIGDSLKAGLFFLRHEPDRRRCPTLKGRTQPDSSLCVTFGGLEGFIMRKVCILAAALAALVAAPGTASALKRSTVAGAGAGAVAGAVVAGPVGAVVGGAVGGYAGSKYRGGRRAGHRRRR